MKRTLLATMLNLLLPPIGYYYIKTERRFWSYLGLVLVAPAVLAAINYEVFSHIGPGTAFASLLFVGILFRVWIVIDTAIVCKRNSAPSSHFYFRMPHGLWFLPAIVVLFGLASAPVDRIKEHFSNAKSAWTSSMEPAIASGDFFFLASIAGPIRRGDIVAFVKRGKSGEQVLLKRVIGLPGDIIRVNPGTWNGEIASVSSVSVNGKELNHTHLTSIENGYPNACGRALQCKSVILTEETDHRRYAIIETTMTQVFPHTQQVLAADEYFLMGDNRDNSLDSRFSGPVKGEDIQARYLYTYFSLDCPEVQAYDPCERPQSLACFRSDPRFLFKCRIRNARIGVAAQ